MTIERFRGESYYSQKIDDLKKARDAGIGCHPIADLSFTQAISFEITNDCNLSGQHCKCPASTPDRYGSLGKTKPITDEIVIECVRQAISIGFRGELMWHYYNEPFLVWPRLRSLMIKIKEIWPQIRLGCFTNGTVLPKDLSELSIIDDLWISNYGSKDWASIIGSNVKRLRVQDGVLDDRMVPMDYDEWRGCLRPFHEIIIDYYGNGHFCCGDWKGEEVLGNVWDDGFVSVADKYLRILNLVRQPVMPPESPSICRRCRLRAGMHNDSVPDIAKDSVVYLFGKE